MHYFTAFIEKNTWAGLEDFYSNLSRSLLIVATDLSRGKKPLTSKKTKKRSARGNALSSSSQFEATPPFVEVIENGELSIPTGLNVKRGKLLLRKVVQAIVYFSNPLYI
jgi:hypothetical protein